MRNTRRGRRLFKTADTLGDLRDAIFGIAGQDVAIIDRMEVYPGISMDPDIRFGKACIAGTRIDVATVVAGVAAGETVEAVANEYGLSVEQVRAALGYAAHIAAHQAPVVRKAS